MALEHTRLCCPGWQTGLGLCNSTSCQLSQVVQLNVGGHLYTTSRSTLRKYPDSRLAELFSGPSKLPTDAEGRVFIDRDGYHFRAVLEFLRSDLLPKEDIEEVGGLFRDVPPSVTPLGTFPSRAGPRGGRVLQHPTADQASGRKPAAFRRTGGKAAVPVEAAALQGKHRGQHGEARSTVMVPGSSRNSVLGRD